MDQSLMWTMAAAGVAIIVWGIRLEGRINAHDALFTEREKQANDRHSALKESVGRIEGKLDMVINDYIRRAEKTIEIPSSR